MIDKFHALAVQIRSAVYRAGCGNTSGLDKLIADLNQRPAAEVIILVSAIKPAWRSKTKRESLIAIRNHCESLAERFERIPCEGE